jgi:hypothetical protein
MGFFLMKPIHVFGGFAKKVLKGYKFRLDEDIKAGVEQ